MSDLIDDPYQVLGIARDATDADIRAAYRTLVRAHHPDANPDDPKAGERFLRIQQAYEILTNPEAAAAHRARVHAHARNAHHRAPAQDTSPFTSYGPRWGPGEEPWNMASSRSGDDVRVTLKMTFRESLRSHERGVSFRITHPCPRCGGTGIGASAGRGCRECQAEGTFTTERNERIQVPACVRSGQILRIRGRGAPGIAGGQPGDLLISCEVADDEVLSWRGDTLMSECAVDVATAVLGGESRCPGPDGPLRVRIPAGVQPGQLVRVRGKGASANPRQPGDLLVRVRVLIPRDPPAEIRAAYEHIRGLGGADTLGD